MYIEEDLGKAVTTLTQSFFRRRWESGGALRSAHVGQFFGRRSGAATNRAMLAFSDGETKVYDLNMVSLMKTRAKGHAPRTYHFALNTQVALMKFGRQEFSKAAE